MRQISIYYTGVDWGAEAVRDDGAMLTLELTAELQAVITRLEAIVDGYKTEQEQLADAAYALAEVHSTDEQIIAMAALVPVWAVGADVIVSQVRRYNDKLYRCLQAHKTQADWSPDKAVSLWAEIGLDEASGADIIEWYEPDSERNYKLDQLVRYTDGKVYKSLLEANVWSPESFPRGWELMEGLK